jgi:hypothetical protein
MLPSLVTVFMARCVCLAGGVAAWKQVLRKFWGSFEQRVKETADVSISEVIDMLDAEVCRTFLRAQVPWPVMLAPQPLPRHQCLG